MSILLTLDSISSGQPSHDFTISFNPALRLDGPYELALLKANLWYSWYNVSAAMGNNLFQYDPGTGYKDIVIPDGQYSINQLNDYIHSVMKANGDSTVSGSGVDVFDVSIVPNYSTLKVDLALSGGYKVTFANTLLYLLLGFNPVEYTASSSGVDVANINNNINTLLIHCDAISSSYENNTSSNVLVSFVPNSGPGTNIEVSPLHLVYLPVVYGQQIDRIRIYLTDNLNRPVVLNSEPTTYQLILRPRDSK